jgi:MFS family permease
MAETRQAQTTRKLLRTYPALGSLWRANGFSLVGDEAYDVVLLLLTTAPFGAVLSVGWLGVTMTLAALVASPLAGAILDRYPARRGRFMRGADIIRAVLVAVFALVLYRSPRASLPIYLLITAVTFLGVGFTAAARASIPRIFTGSGRLSGNTSAELAGANSMFIAQSTAIQIVAPPLFAVLAGIVRPPLIIFFDALTFLASFTLLRGYVRAVAGSYASDEAPASLGATGSGPFHRLWREVREGLSIVNGDRTARVVIFASAIGGGVGFAVLLSLPTLVTGRGLGNWAVGIGLGAVACGAYLGSKSGNRFLTERWRLRVIVLDPLLRAATLVVIAATGNAPAILGSLFVLGASSGASNVARLTVVQSRFDDAVLGRVMSLYVLANQILMPVMPFVWVTLQQRYGLTVSYLVLAALFALTVGLFAQVSSVRREWSGAR